MTLVWVATSLTALLMVVALVADGGRLALERVRLQNAADAAALAGAWGLAEGQGRAIAEAGRLAAENGAPLAPGDVSFPGPRIVHVRLERAPALLNHALGSGEPVAVEARAAAELRLLPVAGLRPFAVPSGEVVGEGETVLKLGAGGGTRGNFRALALEGTGARAYEEAIRHGCGRSVSVGDTVETEPGNMAGPTEQGVTALVASDPTSFEQAVRHPERARRVITVPLVDPGELAGARGREGLRVLGFARFYLVSGEGGVVRGRLIDRWSVGAVPGRGERRTVRLVS